MLGAETVLINAAYVQRLHSYIRRRHLRPLFSSAKQNIRSVHMYNVNFTALWITQHVTSTNEY